MSKVVSIISILILLTILSYSSVAQDNLYPLPLSHTDSGAIYLNDSLYKYFLSKGHYNEASKHLDEIAMIFWKHNYFDQAIKYFEQSIRLNEKVQNYDGIAKINTNLALIYFDKRAYDSAYKYFDKTLAVRRAQDQKVGIISALINQAVVLNKKKEYQLATQKLQEALSLAREINDMKQMRSCYGMLAETYQKAGNVDSAMYYYKYFKTFNDFLTNEEVRKTKAELEKEAALRKVAELEALTKELLLKQKEKELGKSQEQVARLTREQQALYDSLSKKELVLKIFEQKNRITSLENEVLKKEQKKKNTVIVLSLTVIGLLLLLVSLLIYFYHKQRKLFKTISEKNKVISKQKKELEVYVLMLRDKNKQITDSIKYAKGIQKAIFSRNLNLPQVLSDYFEIYLPRDIVSGDFIFSSKLAGKIYLALGDCTGHGVPGAFLTIIGYNLMNHILNSLHITDPEQIILKLNQSFYEILNQAETSNFDGLDVGLCVVDQKEKSLVFVGKNNNLIMTSQKGEFEIIRGDRYVFDLFSHNTEKKFKKKIIHQTQGVWFYLYSDGIIHQMNKDLLKFSTKRLTHLLGELHDLDAKEKRQKIMDTLKDWMLDTEQIDDITIIGFKIH